MDDIWIITVDLAFDYNDSGKVVFLGSSGGSSAVFTESKLIAKSGDIFDSKKLVSIGKTVFINDGGDVVFGGSYEELDAPPGWPLLGIFTQNGLIVKEGDIIEGKTIQPLSGRVGSINNSGEVAFYASFVGGSGIFTQNRLVVEGGFTLDGITPTPDIRTLRINDRGDVVFKGTWDSDGDGVEDSSGIILARSDITATVDIPDFFVICTLRIISRRELRFGSRNRYRHNMEISVI